MQFKNKLSSSRTPDLQSRMDRMSIGPNGETNSKEGGAGDRGTTSYDVDHKSKGKPRSLRYTLLLEADFYRFQVYMVDEND